MINHPLDSDPAWLTMRRIVEARERDINRLESMVKGRDEQIVKIAARLVEAERLLAIRVPAGGINVSGVRIGKGCDLRTVASAIEGPRPSHSAPTGESESHGE